jgi:hypothetical protein
MQKLVTLILITFEAGNRGEEHEILIMARQRKRTRKRNTRMFNRKVEKGAWKRGNGLS